MQNKSVEQIFIDHTYPKDFKSAINKLMEISKLKKKNPIMYFNKEGDIFFSNNHRKLEIIVYLIFSSLLLIPIIFILFIDFPIIYKILSVVFYLPAFAYFYHTNYRALNNVYFELKSKTIKIVPRAFVLSKIYPEKLFKFNEIESFDVKSKSGGNSSGSFLRVYIKTGEKTDIPLFDFYGVADSKLLVHCLRMIIK